MFVQTWFLPFALLVSATVIAIPLSRYMAWIMDGTYRPVAVFRWFERRLDSGPQNWKQYIASLLIFNTVLFVWGFLVLALQKWTPLNPDHKTMLAPSTIFNSVASFMTNTDLQHYSGDQHLSNFSQISWFSWTRREPSPLAPGARRASCRWGSSRWRRLRGFPVWPQRLMRPLKARAS